MDDLREKVILGIENCITTDSVTECRKTECPFIACRESCLEWLLRSALSMLKAQEPVKPDVDVDTWICGKCGHKLEHQEMVGSNILFHEQYSYCPDCGRKVKWNG